MTLAQRGLPWRASKRAAHGCAPSVQSLEEQTWNAGVVNAGVTMLRANHQADRFALVIGW